MTGGYELRETDADDRDAGVVGRLLGTFPTALDCDREVADRTECTLEVAKAAREGAGDPPDLLEWQPLAAWNGWGYHALATPVE